ncbi:MAG: hypothetical protein A3E82_04725 [Gammaproteobacteria bacterium RIFCSPHIGHO2_12_FULL_38_11]|nr:MAG: hypothetical protein A3E82_04725 [Gammaproteobacteria bacterium RIFCSPHIGHO2_12_FULL_38_11]
MNTENKKDHLLWKIAKGRLGFRRNFQSYIVINLFLIAVWYFTGQGHFWPLWVILGWGLGLVIQYLQVFHGKSVDEEYKKLKEQAKK